MLEKRGLISNQRGSTILHLMAFFNGSKRLLESEQISHWRAIDNEKKKPLFTLKQKKCNLCLKQQKILFVDVKYEALTTGMN